MNYIIHFQPKSGSPAIGHQQLKDYFAERANFSINDYQALYNNPDTTVFFTFEYGGLRTLKATRSEPILPVYFKIDFGKPHIFVLEAEPELVEFIRNFNLQVSDLSMHGSGYLEYDEMEFYRGWSSGNEAYYRTFLSNNPQAQLPTLPIQAMEKYWRWNYHVNEMQAELGQQLFIPKIMFIQYQNNLQPAVVWTDAVPIALPRVEKAILYRRSLSSGFKITKKEDIAVVDLASLEPLLKNYSRDSEILEYYTIIYTEPPKEIKQFFMTQKSINANSIKFIPFSEIHDRETIQKILDTK
jgi:hypothetical protein